MVKACIRVSVRLRIRVRVRVRIRGRASCRSRIVVGLGWREAARFGVRLEMP